MASAFRAGLLVVGYVLSAVPVRAQAPAAAPSASPATMPMTGFVPPYEIARIARIAGFDPLAPPLREGTTYVLRATDFRGILMRVVIDARSGAIRDVSRIVPGPGRYGQFYGAPSIYDPADFDAPTIVPREPDLEPTLVRPPLPRTTIHAAAPDFPPLPRARPAALVSRKPPASSEASSAAPPAAAAPKRPPLAAEPLND